MFLHTDTRDAPWTVVKSDCKKRARLNALRYVLHRMPYTSKDVERIGGVDPLIVGRASAIFEQAERRNGQTPAGATMPMRTGTRKRATTKP